MREKQTFENIREKFLKSYKYICICVKEMVENSLSDLKDDTCSTE
jgi:hypothetical protein